MLIFNCICLFHIVKGTKFDETFVRSDLFVDKSELLKVFFTRNMVTHEFFTCPPGFGKTTNLKMIEKFSRIELNEKYTPKCYNETVAYDLFKDLKISKYSRVINEHCAQHPVIFLDLHLNFNDGISKQKIRKGLSSVLRKSFAKYKFLLGKYFKKNHLVREPAALLASKIIKSNLNETEIGLALFYLCRELFYCFDKKIVLLIDGLDHIMNEASTLTSTLGEIDYYYKLLDDMLRKVFNNTKYIYDLTLGITSLAHRHDRFREYVVHRKYTEYDPFIAYFGLLPNELDHVFNKYGCNETEKQFVTKYYSGYRTVDQRDLRYNTGEISAYFKHRLNNPHIPLNYYRKPRKTTTMIWRFLKNPEYFDKVAKLVKHCSFQKKFKTKYDYDHYDIYLDLIANDFKNTRFSDAQILYTYCIEYGIFAPIDTTTYVITNQVMRNLLMSNLRYYFNNELNIDLKLIGFLLHRILHKDLDQTTNLEPYLQKILRDTFQKIEFELKEYLCTYEFVFHSVLHVAALISERLTVDEDFPRPISYEKSEENFNRRCVTLVKSGESAVIIKITLHQSPEMALRNALLYSYEEEGIRRVKYLAIDVDTNDTVNLILYDENRKNISNQYIPQQDIVRNDFRRV